MTVKLWGRILSVVNKKMGVDLCRSPGHVCLSACDSLSACFILADMSVCVFIHNVAATVAASSCVFIYICTALEALLKLLHSEEIHQG